VAAYPWQPVRQPRPTARNPSASLLSFRSRTAQLVGEIGGLLPELTVHDITHLDALWRVADEIAGPDYPVNPAEAFVLGGSFLLHDAAHVIAAYEDGLVSIKGSSEWKDLVAHRFDGVEPNPGSPQERSALFQILRHLHAKQARQLPRISWKVPSTGERVGLLEHFDLRSYYGDLIGEIAESHHWPAHRVVETFERRHVGAPAFLTPATWSVDALKVAFLLRTADAAHIDSQRAPWFLFALRNPDGISQLHWKFQAKMGQPKRTDRGELRLSSGSPFRSHEQQAWWLAYETACMIDRELRHAHALMRDAGRQPISCSSVEHATGPEAFATSVQTAEWEPIDVAPKIGDIGKVIRSLGGTALYGDQPSLALRELIQNAADAVRALRTLGAIEQHEGWIEVSVVREGDVTWLLVTDTGVGMSRHVLTEVLLDFGNSLWSSNSLLAELPGLASKGFKAVGRFGIGFFSVFMLGPRVVVTTHRFRRASADKSDQWLLEFVTGLDGRPTLRRPDPSEELARSGTRVSVALDDRTLAKLLTTERFHHPLEGVIVRMTSQPPDEALEEQLATTLAPLAASLCPTLDIEVRIRIDRADPVVVVRPDDWKTLAPEALLARLYAHRKNFAHHRLAELRETSGNLVGRVGYNSEYFAHAVTTHRGLQSGTVPGIVGVVEGYNNMDLARKESPPVASASAWTQWADQWIDVAEHCKHQALVDMHPLVSGRDLPIYQLSGDRLTEQKLSELLQAES
jgi:hypothetical protein